MKSSSLPSHAGKFTPHILGVARKFAFDCQCTLDIFQASSVGGSNLDGCLWNSVSRSSRHIKESLERVMEEGEEPGGGALVP